MEARLPIFTVNSKTKMAQVVVWLMACTRNRIFEDKACIHLYEDGDDQFAAGMRVQSVKDNWRIEQCGPNL
jgi:hypothetical protein